MSMTQREIHSICRGLESRSKAHRDNTVKFIRALQEQDQIAIACELFSVTESKRGFATHCAVAVMAAVGVPAFATAIFLSRLDPTHAVAAWAFSACAWSPIALYCAQTQLRVYPKGALDLLIGLHSPRLITPLLQSLSSAEILGKKPIREALIRQLPLLNIKAYHWLSRAERTILYEMLNPDDVHATLAVLDALSRNEDIAAIPLIECLLKRPLNPQVASLAGDSLQHLQEVRQAQNVSATLLRPAQNELLSDRLIRASSPCTTEDAKLLLRPKD